MYSDRKPIMVATSFYHKLNIRESLLLDAVSFRARACDTIKNPLQKIPKPPCRGEAIHHQTPAAVICVQLGSTRACTQKGCAGASIHGMYVCVRCMLN